jgi:hypothetical protein
MTESDVTPTKEYNLPLARLTEVRTILRNRSMMDTALLKIIKHADLSVTARNSGMMYMLMQEQHKNIECDKEG